jgi:peptidoglycan/xylan/chitin deacetylase (PgdA/CDA1 family)
MAAARWGRAGALSVAAGLAAAVLVAPVGQSTAAGAVAAAASRPVVVRGTSWLLRDSLTSGSATTTVTFGSVGDFPVTGDWNGDGVATPGVVRGATWLLRNSWTSGAPEIVFSYGRAGDMPVVGDWDGNGTDGPGVVRGGTWLLRNSASGGAATLQFSYGRASDMPVAGDWDGDGRSSPGVIRGATWYLRNSLSSGAAQIAFGYGRAGDRPVVGDWDGNATSTPGVVRGNTWLLRNSVSGGAASVSFTYGSACDVVLATGSAYVRDRGGRPLPARYAGTEVSTLPTTAKVVALTFDAGANADGVASILSTLATGCVPATFFLTGSWARSFPAQTRQIGLRHPIGNHTDSHPDLTTLSDAAVRDQVLRAQGSISAGARYDPRPMFRFPFGARDARTIQLVNGLGYASFRWTVDTLGWQGTSGGQSTSTVVSRVLSTLRPGQIVLLHVGSNPNDGSTLDADALPQLVSQIRSRGYSFVMLTQYL